MNFAEDVTFALVAADLQSNGIQYSDTVTTGATNTECTVASATLNLGTARQPYPHRATRDIQSAYAIMSCYFKAATSATADLRWKIEARNKNSRWLNMREDLVVASGNDGLIFTSNQSGASTPQTVDIPDGTYTPTTLAAALATAMNANGTLTGSAGTIDFGVSIRSKHILRIAAGTTNTVAFSTAAASEGTTEAGLTATAAAATALESDSTIPNQMVISGVNDGLAFFTNLGGASTGIADVPNGTYAPEEYAAALATALNACVTLVGATPTITFTVAVQEEEKMRIAAGTGNTIALGTGANSDAATLCGFDATQAAATAFESQWDIPVYYEANIGTAWTSKNREGYMRLTANRFDTLPCEVRVRMASSESDQGQGRLHNDSQIRVIFKRRV